jgi:dTDP-4-dehydrorhamnose reductase
MSQPKKVLITGASGLLGQAVSEKFLGHYEIIAVVNRTGLNIKSDSLIQHKADLTDKSQTRQLIEKYSPDVVINSAAWVDVDGCENDRDRALSTNYTIVENLAESCMKQDTYFVQISTDYIFDGVDHPAKPDDTPSPLNYYGQTKLLAESYIKENHSNFLIARTCALIGSPNQGQTNLLNYFYDGLNSGKTIAAPNNLFSNPIWVDHLADLILEAVNKHLTGIIHLGGAEYLSRYDFALIFADIFGFDRNLINPVSANNQNRPAKRPQYAGLDIESTKKLFDTDFQLIRDALRQMITLIR